MKKKKYKKIIFVVIVIILILIISVVLFIINYNNSESNEKININTGITESLDLTNKKDLIKSKLELIKNRLKLKDLISKGDNYFQNEQLNLALIQYKLALNKNPDDYKLIEKIGDIYFELNQYNDSTLYYEKIYNNNGFDINKYILSLLYSNDVLKKSGRDNIIKTLKEKVKDNDKIYFYENALYCIEDFHLCKKNFDEKILTMGKKQGPLELIEISNAIKTYNDFGLNDLYYKNSLYVGTFMKLKLYPISIILGKKLLEEKQDYQSILQIVAQSYFNLGNYEKSYFYLKKYFELSPNDANAAYILGIINLKLKEHIISNIFLNKALLLKYSDTLNVRRKIAYNYYMLGDNAKLLNIFDDIIKYENGITNDDINILINFAIDNKDYKRINSWTKIGIKKFPKEPLFYGYIGKVELDNGKLSISKIYLKKGLEIEPNNQLLNYVLGLLYIKENKIDDAKNILNKAYNIDKKSSLSHEIIKELDNL